MAELIMPPDITRFSCGQNASTGWPPNLICVGSVGMLCGYLTGYLTRMQRVEDKALIVHLRTPTVEASLRNGNYLEVRGARRSTLRNLLQTLKIVGGMSPSPSNRNAV